MYKRLLFLISVLNISAIGGELMVQETYFNEDMAVIYLNDLNFSDPANSPLLFEYIINATIQECPYPRPPYIRFQFTLSARIPSLGWEDYKDILSVRMNPFYLKGQMRLSNRMMGSNVDESQIMYDCPEAGSFVDMNGGTFYTSAVYYDELKTQLYRSGQLPGGNYLFGFNVTDENGGQYSFEHELSLAALTALELLEPGSDVESSGEWLNIMNKFPVFQWTGESTSGSEYAIRVCEYDPQLHHNVYEAMRDESVLPYPDNGSFFSLGANVTLYGYDPSTAGKELAYGSYYVWQIRKRMKTSGGLAEEESPVFGFFMMDPAESGGNSATSESDPLLLAIRQLIGFDQFNSLFNSEGELSGFTPEGSLTINGETVTLNSLQEIIQAYQNGELTLKQITVE